MNLTTEQIQFIDNYLESSDIVFADIRMEMVDHVASDIEQLMNSTDTRDFYYVFKDYMIEKKEELLNNNKQFLKSADKKIWYVFLKELKNPMTLLLFLGSCFGFYLLNKNFDVDTFRIFVSIIPLFGFIGFILTYVVYQSVKINKRFSVVERLAFPFFAFYQLPNIFLSRTEEINDTSNLIWLIGGASLAITLMIVLFVISIKLFKNYERQYKSMA
ncbi:hypothetical protein [Winogradskyella forsetii]|uniref:hypothetical protein n=1 Tax=Winogradskyella forsetii TaxID=2686077 RepID=UPI0015BE520C|nr:hypothetical protein [Winogradskyella forsetii]